MNWSDLSQGRCPKCGTEIKRNSRENYRCLKCGFFCKLSNARKIIRDTENKSLDEKANEFLKAHGIEVKKELL